MIIGNSQEFEKVRKKTPGWQKFSSRGSESKVVNLFAGFLCNSKIRLQLKIPFKWFRIYLIKNVFLVRLREPVKKIKTQDRILTKPRVKSEAVKKGDYRNPSGIWKSLAANCWLKEISNTVKQAVGRLALFSASSIIQIRLQ